MDTNYPFVKLNHHIIQITNLHNVSQIFLAKGFATTYAGVKRKSSLLDEQTISAKQFDNVTIDLSDSKFNGKLHGVNKDKVAGNYTLYYKFADSCNRRDCYNHFTIKS